MKWNWTGGREERIRSSLFPTERIERCLELLGETAQPDGGEGGPAYESVGAMDRWLGIRSEGGPLEFERVILTASELALAPSSNERLLLWFNGSEGPRLLVVLAVGRRRVRLAQPNGGSCLVSRADLLSSLVDNSDSHGLTRLTNAPAYSGSTERLQQSLHAAFAGAVSTVEGWRVRPSRKGTLRDLIVEHRLFHDLTVLGLARIASYTLLIASWWMLGHALLVGTPQPALLALWALALLSVVPANAFASLAAGRLSIGFGMLVRRRLLEGSFRLNTRALSGMGVGRLLGRVLEAETFGSDFTKGLVPLITGAVELAATAVVLVLAGSAGVPHLFLLGTWTVLSFLLVRRLLGSQREWTAARLAITNDLVEQLIGHRTRLTYGSPREVAGEDRALRDYFTLSTSHDRAAVAVSAMLPRGWFALGIALLLPGLVAGSGSAVSIAITLGAVVLGYGAFSNLATGAPHLVSAIVAWDRIRPFFDAVSEPVFRPALFRPRSTDARSGALELRDVSFRYERSQRPVLEGVNLRVGPGERIILDGPSGSGKSTVALIMAQLQQPQHGLVLMDGMDVPTWGERSWRSRVTLVPQYHQNHVFTGSFAFNLLMGRGWPPTASDLSRAEEVCGMVGLDRLLTRMPAGLAQMVGETGWKLSDGERGRLFAARALLQEPDVLILDESFGAVDAMTAHKALQAILPAARSVVLIAHP